jgi:hypothetical protein
MNSMERLQCLMAGAMADRRMFTLPLSLYGAGLTGCPLEQYYNDPAAYARGQAAVRETFQPDVLFGPLVVAALAEAFGSRVRYSDKVAPVVSAPAIGSAAEWERLPIPDPDRHPRLLYLREALRRVVAEQGGEVPIAAVLVPPIDLPGAGDGPGWLGGDPRVRPLGGRGHHETPDPLRGRDGQSLFRGRRDLCGVDGDVRVAGVRHARYHGLIFAPGAG